MTRDGLTPDQRALLEALEAFYNGDRAAVLAALRSVAEPRTRCPRWFARTLDDRQTHCTRPAGHLGYCNAYGDPWDGPVETSARG